MAGSCLAQLFNRVGLAPYQFLVTRPFKLGLGDDKGLRAATRENIEHSKCFVDIRHHPPLRCFRSPSAQTIA